MAAAAVRLINPDIKVTAHQAQLGPGTEKLFGSTFFRRLDGAVSALDTLTARECLGGAGVSPVSMLPGWMQPPPTARRRLPGELLHPLPHGAAGHGHRGGKGQRAGHGAPPEPAAGARQRPRGWELPTVHAALLPLCHRAYAAGMAVDPCTWPFGVPSHPDGRMWPRLLPARGSLSW